MRKNSKTNLNPQSDILRSVCFLICICLTITVEAKRLDKPLIPETNLPLITISGKETDTKNAPGLDVGFEPCTNGQISSLQIRGKDTLTSSSFTLIVLDEVIYTEILSDINPNYVASIDILKDVSSTAVFEARSANGIVLISIKNGKAGKPVITFNRNIGIRSTVKRVERIKLNSRETKTVKFFIKSDNLKQPDKNMKWVVKPCIFEMLMEVQTKI